MSHGRAIRGTRSGWMVGCAFGLALGAPGLAHADWGTEPSSDLKMMESAQGTPGATSTCVTATCVSAPSQDPPPPEPADAAHSEYEPATRSNAPVDETAHPYDQSRFQLGAGHQD